MSSISYYSSDDDGDEDELFAEFERLTKRALENTSKKRPSVERSSPAAMAMGKRQPPQQERQRPSRVEERGEAREAKRARGPNLVLLDADIENLWPGEVEFLRQLYERNRLSQTWGYRSGAAGEHERFEKETHDPKGGEYPLLALQTFSDPVFRTVEEVGGRGFTKVFRTTLEKTVVEPTAEAQRLLNDFMGKRGMRSAMQELADYPLDGSTFAFAFVVISAQALLDIAGGHFKRAKELRDAFRDPSAFRLQRERL